MTEIDRRTLVGGFVMASSLAAAAGSARSAPAEVALKDLKKEAEIACLYHCDFGDQRRFEQMLGNISNHLSVYNSDPFAIQIVVVAHGPGVKFFLTDLAGSPWKDEKVDPAAIERMTNLGKNGVKVHLCAITFQKLNIDRAKARTDPFIDIVPSGVATVAALQSKGFAYLKVG